jgi:Zn-dependent protease with chaperone function
MRFLAVASFLAFSFAPVLAQSYRPVLPEPMIQHFCGAPQVSSGAEFDRVASITQRLAIANPRIKIALAMSPFINAWDVELSANVSLICIPIGMVHFMSGEEGELAFILAHEFGHAVDDRCKSLSGRARLVDHSSFGIVLAAFFGCSSGSGAREQRACENRADELGVSLITRAGYDPQNAVSALGRFSVLAGQSGTGPIARLAALGQDHPITSDRIRHVRKLIARQSARPPQ